MTVTFVNGDIVEATAVRAHTARYNGDTRNALTVMFDRADRSLDALFDMFDPPNCEQLTVTDEDGDTTIYADYVIRDLFRLDSDGEVTVRMLQRSQLEKQLARLTAEVNA